MVVHEHSLEELEEDSHGNGLDDNLDAAVDDLAVRLKAEAGDSCTVVAHPDRPGLKAVHEPRRASAAAGHSDLVDHLDLPQGRAHSVHTAQMPGQKRLATRQDGRDIAG